MQPPSFIARSLTLGLILGVSACDGSSDPGTDADVGLVPFASLFVEERSIVLEQDSADLLASPGAVLRWGENFAITDALQGNIRIHDSSGRLLRTIGRPGHGPGEFRSPSHAVVTPDGGLLVFDRATLELTKLSSTGSFEWRRQASIPWLGSVHRVGDHLLASGYTLDAVGRAEPGVTIAPVHLLGTDGAVMQSMGEMVVEPRSEQRMNGVVLAQPISDSLVVFARISEQSVRLLDPRTGTQRSVDGAPPGYTAPALPREEIRDIVAAQRWSNAQTLLSNLLPAAAGHFIVTFSGPAPDGGRAHTYTLVDPAGRRVLSTQATDRFVRPLGDGTFFQTVLEEEGARLVLYRMARPADGERLAVHRGSRP